MHQLPVLWENWSIDVTAIPGGGFAAVMLAPGPDEVSGTLLLATCESLDCPQPTVRRVIDVPLPGGWQGGGAVAVAADPLSGSLGLGYFDPSDGSLWLGGCPAGCADGPVLSRVGAWPQFAGQPPHMPSLHMVATSTGPMAVLGMTALYNGAKFGAPRAVAVITCGDQACAASQPYFGGTGFVTATLAMGGTGDVFFFGNVETSSIPMFGRVGDGWMRSLIGEGEVVGAAFGPDGSLRLVLDDEHGIILITCANQFCSAP